MRPTIKKHTQRFNFMLQSFGDFVLKILMSRGFLLFTYGYFLFQSAYLAISTKWRIVPDAHTHLGRIRLFARDGMDPFIQNQNGFYYLGDMIRNPDTLYHYLFSFVYRFTPFEDVHTFGNQLPSADTTTIFLIKFLNIGLVLVGLVIFYKLMKQLGLSKLARNISLFMMTNSLMFIFLSGGINYDNMLFLLSMTVFYFFVKFMQTSSFRALMLLLSLLAITGLVKVSFMPIGVVIFFITLYLAIRRRGDVFSEIKAFSGGSWLHKIALGALVALLLVSSALFVERYGVNLVKYGSPQPGCLEIHTREQCSNNALFVRAQEFKQNAPTYKLGPAEFSVKWFEKMRLYTFIPLGHKAFDETNIIHYGSYIFAGLMVIAAFVKFDRKEKEINTLLFIAVYFVIVLLGVNYFRAYMDSGIFGTALQGRYTFPVLPLLYAIGNHYVFQLLSKNWLKTLYALFILAIFIPSGVLNYIFWSDKSWHTEFAPDIHYVIQEKLRWFNAKILEIFH